MWRDTGVEWDWPSYLHSGAVTGNSVLGEDSSCSFAVSHCGLGCGGKGEEM